MKLILAQTCIIALTLLVFVGTQSALGSEIVKVSKKAVIVEFDPFEENFAVGDRLVANQDGKKKALVEITKIKGKKFLGRILNGRAEIGMKLSRLDLVAEAKPSPAAPNVESVTIRFQSAAVWRGRPYGRPYIAASIDLVNPGLLGGLTMSNSDLPSTSEVDAYVGYAINRINWTLTPMVARYIYPGAQNWDSWDFMLGFTYRILSLDISYIPKYFGDKSTAVHARIGLLVGISSERWKVLAQVGSSTFSDVNAVRHSNYMDYKAGLLYTSPEFLVEFAYTDTNRKNPEDGAFKDGTASVSISKRF